MYLFVCLFFYLSVEFSDEDVASQSKEDEKSLHLLSEKLSEVTATHNLILQKHHDILKTLAELDDKELAQSGSGSLTKLKEKIAMFKITSSAMAKVCNEIPYVWLYLQLLIFAILSRLQ